MQISLTHPTETEAKLVVIASASELQTLKDDVVRQFQGRVRVQGFRAGKAPLALVEKNLDPATLQAEFLEQAINQMYVQAITEKRLRVVNQPEVSVTKFVPFTTLEFTAAAEIVGEVTLPDYKKIKKSPATVKITAEDVKAVLETLRTRLAEKKDVDRTAKAGDQVFIDFKGTDKAGEAIKGAEGNDYPLLLGSNSFIPGFEDNLLGMKGGQDKTFTLKFPKDYGVKALANKDVTFAVTMTKVQEVVLPKLDDEFATKAGPFKTLQGLKDDVKKQLEAERTQEAERDFENELIEEIASKTKVALPKTLVEDQIDRMEQEEKQNLVYRGQTWQEHLDEEGVTAEEHRAQKREAAEVRVRAGLALAEISEKEDIQVAPEELEVRMQLLRGQYQDKAMQAELSKPETRRDINSRMLTEKTIAKIKAYATGA
jgi:trigger factor